MGAPARPEPAAATAGRDQPARRSEDAFAVAGQPPFHQLRALVGHRVIPNSILESLFTFSDQTARLRTNARADGPAVSPTRCALFAIP